MYHVWLPASKSGLHSLLGASFSIGVHAVVLAGAALMAGAGSHPHSDPSLIFPVFLPPPDRAPSMPRELVLAPWVDMGTGGAGAAALPAPEGVGRNRSRDDGETEGDPRDDAGRLLPGVGEMTLDSIFSAIAVDSEVVRIPSSAMPLYPADLLNDGIEGIVYAQFVVDTTGLVDPESIRILTSAHPAFTASVIEALDRMRYRPAIRDLRKVRQLVEQHFLFRLLRPNTL